MYYICVNQIDNYILEEYKVVTARQIMTTLGVSFRLAQQYASNTRKFYSKDRGGSITMGQVLKANNLEK